ncbi:MAG: hypothetical protein ACFFCW_06200 [Candidatus Hodarchaeota archaeon]
MNEPQSLMSKLHEKGLFYYLMHPQYVIRYGFRMINKLLERLPPRHEVLYIVEMPLSLTSLSSNTLTTNIPTTRIESVSQLFEFASLRETEDPIWKGKYQIELKRRFSRGDLCFAGLENGKIVSVEFATFRQYYCPEIDYLLTLPNKACALFDAYTLMEFRGRGFYKATNYSLLSCLLNLRFQTLYGWIPPSNIIAFDVHNRLGFTNIAMEITMHQFLGFRQHVIRKLNISVDEFLHEAHKNIP